MREATLGAPGPGRRHRPGKGGGALNGATAGHPVLAPRRWFRESTWLHDYAAILLGSAMLALAISALIVPNRLADGGLMGVAIVLHYLLHLGVGPVYAALNIPLLLWAWRTQGRRFVWRTAVGVGLIAVWTAIFARLPPLVHDRLLAALYGGLGVGAGIGLLLRAGGSSGGSDVLARYLDLYHGWGYNRTLVLVDMFVLTSVAVWVGLPAAMYAWVATNVAGRVAAYVVEGARRGKLAIVVSARQQAVAARVTQDLRRGATRIPGTGVYTDQNRPVLLVAVGDREVAHLRDIVAQEDPQAFVILLPASEVRGEGFADLAPAAWDSGPR